MTVPKDLMLQALNDSFKESLKALFRVAEDGILHDDPAEIRARLVKGLTGSLAAYALSLDALKEVWE